MARRLNLTAPDIGTPDGDRPDGFYLDEGPGDPGTPILADLKNDIYYFFNKMMDEAAITYNNVVDTQTLSQYFEALRISANKPDFEQITSSSSLSISGANKDFELDVSIGNLSLIMPVPDFLGQKIHLYASGSGVAGISGGNGIVSTGIFITENTGGANLEAVDVGGSLEWKAANEITADYVSGGDQHVIQRSNGEQSIIIFPRILGNNTTLTSIPDIAYAVPFSDIVEIFTGPMVSKPSPVSSDIKDYISGYTSLFSCRINPLSGSELITATNLAVVGGAVFSAGFAYAFKAEIRGKY